MPFITANDGAQIYYKDWGQGRPVVFSHGWPLSADAWDAQMLFLGQHGYRVIAHDRRGHGRSEQTWDGNHMDQYADDVAVLFDTLDLQDAVFVGHSTGGGEVARYLGRHGTARVAKAVLLGAVPPRMADHVPMAAFDGIRAGLVANRGQSFLDFTDTFYGYNRAGATPSESVKLSFWMQGMMGGQKPLYDCIKAFSETDFKADLQAIDIPVLVVHGDDDQVVPIDISGRLSAAMLPKGELKVYPGAPHGLATTHADQFNADLLAFIEG